MIEPAQYPYFVPCASHEAWQGLAKTIIEEYNTSQQEPIKSIRAIRGKVSEYARCFKDIEGVCWMIIQPEIEHLISEELKEQKAQFDQLQLPEVEQ